MLADSIIFISLSFSIVYLIDRYSYLRIGLKDLNYLKNQSSSR